MHKDHIGYKIRTVSNKLHRQFTALETARGLEDITRLNGWILCYLFDHRDFDTYQKDIEENFDISRSTTTGVLKSMEQKGYIKRISVDCDARLKKLILTQKGYDLHNQTTKDIDMLDESLIENIPQEELDIFYKVLNKIGKRADNNVATNFTNIFSKEEQHD